MDRITDTLPLIVHGSRPPRLKRGFDVLLSGLGLLGLAPFWGLSYKLGDSGPISHGQTRMGRGADIPRAEISIHRA